MKGRIFSRILESYYKRKIINSRLFKVKNYSTLNDFILNFKSLEFFITFRNEQGA